MKIFPDKIFAIVDVETTGGSPVFDRVIEVGILRIENGKVVKTFNTLIDPERPLPPSIEMITGIAEHDLRGAPTFENVAHEVFDLLNGAVFVAHNARFDYGFLKNELKREGLALNSRCLCTVRLSRRLFPSERKHDLTSIIERHSLECENRHRAFDDAKVLVDFMEKLESENPETLEEAIKSLLKENTLPQFLDEKSVRSLPEGPGVYTFYGEHDEVLYIGKSRNIRHRVLSHFSNDHAASKEMHLCQQTARVEAEETNGELGALLLESEKIKNLSPLYNRVLRRRSELVVARQSKVGDFSTVFLERLRQIEPETFSDILAVFKNQRQAKEFLSSLRETHMLCGKLLGLEKGKGACFYRELNKCAGACIQKERAEDYNERFKAAFKERRIKAWPFGGPILIEERKDDAEKHSFVLDNWCLLYDVVSTEDEVKSNEHPRRFDYDSYKILLRYIKNPLNKKKIRPISYDELEQGLGLMNVSLY